MLRDLISIARYDHWFKNVFMLPGVVLAYMAAVSPPPWYMMLYWLVTGLLGAGLVCSANYTLNEIMDAETDKNHPVKRLRPIPSGRVWMPAAYAQWVVLSMAGLALSWHVGTPFLVTNAVLLVMGVIYNVPPIRSKDIPVADVLSESFNNPLRFLLGWYLLQLDFFPPVSVLVAYWMLGAFFMAVKRFSECRFLCDKEQMMLYRKSFGFYTTDILLLSIVFYASSFTLFAGIFLILYKMELILATPLYAGLMAYYLWLGMLPDSPTQYPERLYKQKLFMGYLITTVIATFLCFQLDIPGMYELFETTVPQGF